MEGKMKKVMFFMAAAIIMGTTAAYAATTQEVQVQFEIPGVFDLTWAADGSSVDLTGANAITVFEFAAGFKSAIAGGTLATTANVNYDLTVAASGLNFVGGSGTKPTSEFLVNANSAGYQPLDGINEVTLISDHVSEISAAKDIEYQILLFPDDTAGVYSTTLTYTLKMHI
jgi:hypothetical protein